MKVNISFSTIVILALLLSACKDDNFDRKSYNLVGAEVKAEMNKLSIPCPVGEKSVAVANLESINLDKFSASSADLELYNPYLLKMEDYSATIILNKVTKDGFQFKYEADVTEYELGSKPLITRDAGTVWLYCDDHKKHNEPTKKPELPASKMVTVE